MFTIKSPLKYFPITVGDYKLTYDSQANSYDLLHKNHSWMGYDQNTHWQSTEFFIELEFAKGVCVTTGLGLGILQSNLCLKQDVTKVIVYEQSKEVIEIFNKIAEHNNFDFSKLEIINEDANQIEGKTCDCLFPDHFDSEDEKYIIDVVKNLSYNNKAEVVWYWPAGSHFIQYILKNNLLFDNESYCLWKKYTGIKNLPESFSDKFFDYFAELKRIYIEDVKFSPLHKKIEKIIERNNLLKLTKKLR